MKNGRIFRLSCTVVSLFAFFLIPCSLLAQQEATGGADAKNATLIIIKPDKISKSSSAGQKVETVTLEPGTILLVPDQAGLKNTAITVKAGQTYHLLASGDGESQKILGDALYASGNRAGALAAYQSALAIDSSMMGQIYRNYAELIAESGKPADVIRILNKLIAAGRADTATYSALGKTYVRLKDYPKAIEIYSALLQKHPKSYSALSGMALAQQRSGDLQGCIETVQNAIKVNPGAIADYKLLGEVYQTQSQSEKAITAFEEYLTRGGPDTSVAEKIGMYYYGQGLYERSAKYLFMVRRNLASNPRGQYMLGDSYFQIGEYTKAIGFLQASQAKLPPNLKIEAYRKLSEAYLNNEENKKALNWFNLYLKLNKKTDAKTAYLHAFLIEKSDPVKSSRLYESNIKLYPEDYRNYLRLGLVYSKAKSTRSQAVGLLEKAAERADTVATIWLEIAKVWGKIGNNDEELAAYKRYLRSDPENVEANVRIGTLLLGRKNNEGVGFLETALKKDPNNLNLMLLAARGYIQAGRHNDALALLRKAQATDPKNGAVGEELITVYIALKMDAQALDELKKKLETKRDPDLLLQYAKLLLRTGKQTEAAETVEDILAVNPESVEALMIKVAVLKTEQKSDEILEVCKEVNIIDPNFAPGYHERAEVYRVQKKVLWAEKYYLSALKADPGFALAEVGLAEIALLRNKKDEYRKHIQKAYELNPDDPEVLKKYQALD